MKKNKKSIFITGAASGIGKATAIYFAKMGWEVGLFDINEDGLENVAKEIGHNSCMYQKLDVTDIEEWNSARESFEKYTNGKCDLFFNNAGIANFTGRVEDIPIKESQKIVDVNLNGVINGIYAILPLLKKTDKSVIVNTSSIGGFVPVPGAAVYSATKFAVRGLTESLNVEFHKYGIAVCEINPWFTETPILNAEQVTQRMDGTFNRDKINEISKIYPAAKVAEAVFSVYRNKKVHNKVGWEGKLASFVMNYFPFIIRSFSRNMYKKNFD